MRCQNIVLLFFDVSGTGAMTSQCSTSLPFVTRKMSTLTAPCGLLRPAQWAWMATMSPSAMTRPMSPLALGKAFRKPLM
jgi:hypothetical protein